MRDLSSVGPTLLLGGLLGFALATALHDPSFTAANTLGPAATLTAAWWIQRTLRRQGELGRIPIDHVSRLCQRIDTLITACLDRPAIASGVEPDLLQSLSSLGNELNWLTMLVEGMKIEEADVDQILDLYVAFKRQLTLGPRVDLRAATETARAMRVWALKLQWKISEWIVDDPARFTQLQALRKAKERRN